MTDERKALLGDKEAAKRLTERGVLVPCPFCWKDAVMHVVESGPRYAEHKKEIPKGARFLRCVCYPNGKRYFEYCVKEYIPWCVDTGCCGRISKRFKTLEAAISAWNTRAPILSEEEVEMLDGKENP